MTSETLDKFDQLKAAVSAVRLQDGPLRYILLDKNDLLKDGNVVELGTGTGNVTKLIANNVGKRKVYTFDWFNGNVEHWRQKFPKGYGSLNGEVPQLPVGVTLYNGLFSETIPKFVQEHKSRIALLFVDCDIYSSTKTALTGLAPRLKSGSVVVFDEFFGYDEWKDHEAKAFLEFLNEHDKKYVIVGMRGDPNVRNDWRQQKAAFRIYDSSEKIEEDVTGPTSDQVAQLSSIVSVADQLGISTAESPIITSPPEFTDRNLFKVQLIIPYGRKEYFECLFPYIHRNIDLFDGVWIWENTTNKDDIQYLHDTLSAVKESKIVIKCPTKPTGDRSGVYPLYSLCKDEDTLYIKIDDDVTWVAPNAFKDMINYSLANRNNNCVFSANMINSGPLDAKHQENGASRQGPIKFNPLKPYPNLMKPDGANQVHESLQEAISADNVNKYYCYHSFLNNERWSINCIAFMGNVFNDKDRAGLLKDDERYITKKLSTVKGNNPTVCPTAVMAHYSFDKQRSVKTGFIMKKKKASGFDSDGSILSQYKVWAKKSNI